MEALPPMAVGDDGLDPQEPCGSEGEACSREKYEGWWERGEELYRYLDRMPEKYTKGFGMAGLHRALVRRWHDEVKDPTSVGEEVSSETLGTLLVWIRQSETLIYYVTYQDQEQSGKAAVPGPTTPGLLEVVERPQVSAWHWPWIKGWDDPQQRSLILNPPAGEPKRWTLKKVLVVGAIGGAAIYAGKKMLDSNS